MSDFELRCIRGEHWEVYYHGRFLFSADTKCEALRMIEEVNA